MGRIFCCLLVSAFFFPPPLFPESDMSELAGLHSVTYYPFGVELEDIDLDRLAGAADQAAAIGFNAFWLVVPWRSLSPCALPEVRLDPAAWEKLDAEIRLLSDRGFRIILPLGYFGRGWAPEGIPDEGIEAWILDEPIWNAFQEHVLRLVRRYADRDEILWMFYTESFEGPIDVFERIPLAMEHFRRYCRRVNPDIRWWNQRWGTEYASFEAVGTPNGASAPNAVRWEDHFRWICSVLRSRYGDLTRRIQALPDFRGKIGYHDNSLITLDWAGGDTPIPQDEPYDFLSFTAYLEDRSVEEGLRQAGAAFQRFRSRYPDLPLMIGEAGVPTLLRGETVQAEYLERLARFAEKNALGINIWMWRDFTGASEKERSMGLLSVDGTGKPVVEALRRVWETNEFDR